MDFDKGFTLLFKRELKKEREKYTGTELAVLRVLIKKPRMFSFKLGCEIGHGSITTVVKHLRGKGIKIDSELEHTNLVKGKRRLVRYAIAKESIVYCGFLVGLNVVVSDE